jgi:hypothetical protein
VKSTSLLLSVTACALAITLGCSEQLSLPSAPSAVDPALVGANADGSTLKVTAPTLQSPINGVRLPQGEPVVLTFGNSTTTFASAVPLSYRIEVTNAAGANVETAVVAGGTNATSRPVTAALDGEQAYQWRVRAEYQGNAGPWSAVQSFVAPVNDGYIRGNELYDPLINGKTIGEVHGPVTFIPGVGVRLDSPTSYISYELQQTLSDGELSVLVTNVASATPGLKTKLFAMGQGYDDITTNARRFTVEKRGDKEPGSVAWRVIASNGAIETIGAERRTVNFLAARTYFWRAAWGAASFRLTINDGGVSGQNVYDFSRDLLGVYNPTPHVIFLGSPPNRSGSDNQSVPGATYRQVWVSRNPRPSFANE